MQSPRISLREVPWSNPVGADLRAARHAELEADGEPGPDVSIPPEDMDVFLVAYEQATGQPLGCGGLRLRDDKPEIKGLYVVPYARGSGVPEAIVAALEHRAHAEGGPRC